MNSKKNDSKRSLAITHNEMLHVISEWSRCLRESHAIGGRVAPLDQCPPEVQREIAVLRALALLVKINRLQSK